MSVLRKLRRHVTGQGGYNLIELLITVAILSTVVGALTVLFVQATNAEFDMNRRFQAQLAARQAIDKMRREIHCSSGITPTGASTSISVTLPAMVVLGPLIVVQYRYWVGRQGPERTTQQYVRAEPLSTAPR